MLTGAQILALDDLPRKAVDVPEWNTTVYVRAFTAAECDRLSKGLADGTVTPAGVVVLVAVAEDGSPLFTPDDAEALDAKNGRAVGRIAEAAMAFNFPDAAELDEAKKA